MLTANSFRLVCLLFTFFKHSKKQRLMLKDVENNQTEERVKKS